MALTHPELDMKWWNSNLANNSKYADWAKKNLTLAKAVGHVEAARLLGKKDPGRWLDAAIAVHDLLEDAAKKCKDKDLKTALGTLMQDALRQKDDADNVKRQITYHQQDEKTKKLMDESMNNVAGRRTPAPTK